MAATFGVGLDRAVLGNPDVSRELSFWVQCSATFLLDAQVTQE